MPDRGDLPLELAIDRYWDELFLGDPAGSLADELAPELVATVRRVHALNVVPPADPTFASRLWEDLTRSQGVAGDLHLRTPLDATAFGRAVTPSRRPAPLPIDPPRIRPRWGVAHLASAAVLLLILLGIGYLVFGPGLPGTEPRNTIPAAVVPTPTPSGMPNETLVEVTIPAEALPAGIAGSAFDHITVPPGIQTTWTVPQNVILRYVLEGTLTIRADTPTQVLRAGEQTWTDVATDAEVDLGPGDAMLLFNATSAEFVNRGSIPVEMLGWILAAGNSADSPVPAEWIINDYSLSGAGALSLPGRPGTLRLQRVIMAPNDSLPAAPDDVLRHVVRLPDNGAGTPVVPYVIKQPGGEVDNFGTEPTAVYLLTLEIAGGAGTPVLTRPMPVS